MTGYLADDGKRTRATLNLIPRMMADSHHGGHSSGNEKEPTAKRDSALPVESEAGALDRGHATGFGVAFQPLEVGAHVGRRAGNARPHPSLALC